MMSATTTFLALLGASLFGQAESAKGEADERLDLMRKSVEVYRFQGGEGPSARFLLKAEPAFRMGKQPADDVEEGAIFFWLDAVGRPEAAVQVFQVKNARQPLGTWIHEFVSLSPGTFAADRGDRPIWAPRTGGVAFAPIPGAPVPADSASRRDQQMRALARSFRVSDDFKERGSQELRLLPTPIARYGRGNAQVQDGALFAFVLGTDPEAFLFIEARPGAKGAGAEWQFAFAPMGCFAEKGTRDRQSVWSTPLKKGDETHDPSRTYFVLVLGARP